jgi:Tyrosine phosphatase family
MVHCALGKDRTGVVIAVVLAALGVTRSAILDDQGHPEVPVMAIAGATGPALVEHSRTAQLLVVGHRGHGEIASALLAGAAFVAGRAGPQPWRGPSTQNSLPSGSASTTHGTSAPWPTSTRVAPWATNRATSASWSSGRKSGCRRF